MFLLGSIWFYLLMKNETGSLVKTKLSLVARNSLSSNRPGLNFIHYIINCYGTFILREFVVNDVENFELIIKQTMAHVNETNHYVDKKSFKYLIKLHLFKYFKILWETFENFGKGGIKIRRSCMVWCSLSTCELIIGTARPKTDDYDVAKCKISSPLGTHIKVQFNKL